MTNLRAFLCHSLLVAFVVGCGDVVPAMRADATADRSETGTTPTPACGTGSESSCCCAGDAVDQPFCSAGALTCRAGYSLYSGDACRCLPDRDTPCCLPHVRDAGGPTDAAGPCPNGTACFAFRAANTHGGSCPSVVYFGTPCSDRCLACAPTGPDGGPGFGTGDPCVCDGARWVCPSDNGIGCGAATTCWLAGPPPTCP